MADEQKEAGKAEGEKPKPRARRTPAKQPAAAKAKTAERKPARRRAAKPEAKPAAPETPAQRPLVRASAKYVRTSARKARLVVDHIRGKDVEQARAILQFTPRAVARDVSKLLESAVANAEHNHELSGDELRIAEVRVDEGPTLKRYRPRALGRATKINKRTSHMSITLTTKETV